MEQKGIALTILGIVAIIAVVGLVLLFVNKPKVTRGGEATLATSLEEEELSPEERLSKKKCEEKCEGWGGFSGGCYSGKDCPIGTLPAGECNWKLTDYPYYWYKCCCKKVQSTSVAGSEGYYSVSSIQ